MKRKKVLFICTGNTCRSPMAEAIFRSEIKKRKIKFVDVVSAGIFAENSEQINPLSAAYLDELKIDYSKFKPRQLKHKMIESSYMTICMTQDQKDLLSGFDNVYAMCDIVGFDIPDPYGKDYIAYKKTGTLLYTAIQTIIDRYFVN